jgi:hypothetical protein
VEEVGEWWRKVDMVQMLYTHVCKWKNNIYWKYSRNGGIGRWRRMLEWLNSSKINLIYYKNFCKCHNVPPPKTIIKRCIFFKMLLH